MAWQPELVLVNLGNNDRDREVLARELERIARRAREAGIRVAFVPEANCIESRSAASLRVLEANHAALREVAARRGIPVVEVHAPLVAERRLRASSGGIACTSRPTVRSASRGSCSSSARAGSRPRRKGEGSG